MTSYHINPATGNVAACKATKQCPFGDLQKDHYTSAEAARAAYEAKMAEKSASAEEPAQDSSGETVYRILPAQQEAAIKSLQKANRRLERYGIADRFEYSFEEKFAVKKLDGMELADPYFELTVNTPTIGLAGQRFLAAVTQEDGGFITRTGAGVELNGWRPTSMLCEHCGQHRARAKTYLIEGSDGERKQIGSSCVQAYLGVKPEGLWALGYEPIDLPAPAEGGISLPASAYHRPVDDTLAYALAVSNGAESFVSRAAAQNFEKVATADAVTSALFGTDKNDASWRREMAELAEKYKADGTVAKVRKHIQELEGMSDYAVNLRTLASGEWVSPRSSTLLVSGLASYRRTLTIEKKAAGPQLAAGFAGHVGEKLAGRTVTVDRVVSTPSYNSYTRQDETSHRVELRDEHNHRLVWWTSSAVNAEEGATLQLKGGTVKKHDSFNGVDQTILTRVKFEETPAP
jgi:hypothetical protein